MKAALRGSKRSPEEDPNDGEAKKPRGKAKAAKSKPKAKAKSGTTKTDVPEKPATEASEDASKANNGGATPELEAPDLGAVWKKKDGLFLTCHYQTKNL